MEFWLIVSSLFFVINPLGNTPFIVSILSKFDERRQRVILARELFFALALALFFQYGGEAFLSLLSIDETTVGICGGVVLFLIAMGLIFPDRESEAAAGKHEPFVVPIATPVLSGAGTMTAVMLFAAQEPSALKMTTAIVVAYTFVAAVVMLAPTVQRFLGKRGLIALEQLMGMLLTFLSLNILIEALIRFVQNRS